jgi:hypothetical protein
MPNATWPDGAESGEQGESLSLPGPGSRTQALCSVPAARGIQPAFPEYHHYAGGSKGGVGKSTLAFALIDYLTAREKNILLLETDNANPDVYKTHKAHESTGLVCKAANLDAAEGWIELVNLCGENPGHAAVVNAAARSNAGREKYGATLKETLPDLQRELTAFWIINRQRDSIELLRSFLDIFRKRVCMSAATYTSGTPKNSTSTARRKPAKASREKG